MAARTGRGGVRARLSTVRAKTTAAAVVIVAAALALGGFVTLAVLSHSLVDDVDAAARRRSQDVAELAGQNALPPVLSAAGEQATIVQVVDDNGAVVSSSANFAGREPILADPFRAPQRVRTVSNLPVHDEQGDDFRVVTTVVQTKAGPVAVNAGESMETVYEGVAAVRRILLVGLPVMLVLVGLTTWYVVGRALRPVDAIRRKVADISAHDLSRRVPQPAADDEVGRLAETMNAMLDRLESFSDRQQRFVADASHELQSPLAATLADLELAMRDSNPSRWEQTAAGLVADTQRMTKLVQDLLLLARVDEADVNAPGTLVDLDDVVQYEVARLRTRAAVAIDTGGIRPVEVRGNPDQLARAVRNLLENAGRYARSSIAVELVADDGAATLTVRDDGPGVPDEVRPRIFDRFTRADDSRSRQTGGTGLGLAIAREIVVRHGGSIALATNGPGACFEVRIPITVAV